MCIFAPSNERLGCSKRQKMIKTNVKLKAFVLSMGVAAMLLTAPNLKAQDDGSRGLFGRGKAPEEIMEKDEPYLNRGGLFNLTYYGYNIGTQIFGSDIDGGFNIYTQQFGYEEEETPLGSGFIVLTLAGAAYAIRKRKNNKKTIN